MTAANIIKDIWQYCSEQTKPECTEQSSTYERNIPESVHLFLTERTLKIRKHSVSRSENITRAVESYEADLIHGVSRGEIMTLKHF